MVVMETRGCPPVLGIIVTLTRFPVQRVVSVPVKGHQLLGFAGATPIRAWLPVRVKLSVTDNTQGAEPPCAFQCLLKQYAPVTLSSFFCDP